MTDPALPIATAFLAKAEGFRSAPYRDVGGVWTIGYGFTVTEEGRHVDANTAPVTQEAAYLRLEAMVARVVTLVRGMVSVPVTDHQIAALTSFAFNLGTNALRISTLLKLLNQGHIQQAAQQFAAWVYADNAVYPGLVKRRAAEAALFLEPDSAAPTVEGDAAVTATPAVASHEVTADDLNAEELKATS